MIVTILFGLLVGLLTVVLVCANPTIGFVVEIGEIRMFFFSKRRAERFARDMEKVYRILSSAKEETGKLKD